MYGTQPSAELLGFHHHGFCLTKTCQCGCFRDAMFSLLAKFSENMCNSDRVMGVIHLNLWLSYWVLWKFKIAAAAILDFVGIKI